MNWNAIQDDRLRRASLQREAAASRLANSGRSRRHAPQALRAPVAWTGRRLVSLGFALLSLAREWDYRCNTMYNGAKSSAQ